ncbi:hypothetical protein BM1_00342 [Bipolaris maydis]|nr:hypothetical protein BM1_00342 [Bipolaris maydis]
MLDTDQQGLECMRRHRRSKEVSARAGGTAQGQASSCLQEAQVSKTLLVGPSSLAQQRTVLDGENGDERINTLYGERGKTRRRGGRRGGRCVGHKRVFYTTIRDRLAPSSLESVSIIG